MRSAGGQPSPVYAYTTYHIHIYTLSLTTPGYLKLRERIAYNKNLVEASDVELAQQRSIDGQQTYHLEALLQSYPDPSLFEAEIQRIPDSYRNEYTTYSAGRSKINYIFGAGQIQEDTGGNMSKISCDLTTDESGMLLMLAAHAKQLSVVLNTGNSIKLYDNGWMKIDSDSIYEIVEEIGRNLGKVSRSLLEILPRERFVRIKLDPKIIFLDFQYFGIRLEQYSKQHWKLDLIRETIDTPIGCVTQGSISVEPTPSNAMELKKIIAGRGTDDSDLLNKLRKQLQSTYQKEGLVRLLGKKDNKEVVLCRIHDCNSP